MNTPSTRALAIIAIVGVLILGAIMVSNMGGGQNSAAAAAFGAAGGGGASGGGSSGGGGIVSSISNALFGGNTQTHSQTPGTVYPATPTNFTAVINQNNAIPSVYLTWSDTGDYVYDVYRNGQYVGITTSQNYLDPGLASNTTYTYTVDAFDKVGRHSTQSSPAQVTTTAYGTVLASPTGLKVTNVTNTSVSFSWNAAIISNQNSVYAYYPIYINYNGVAYSTSEYVVGNTATYDYLKPDTTYAFAVSAALSTTNTNSAPSATLFVKTLGGLPDRSCAISSTAESVASGDSVGINWLYDGYASSTSITGIGSVTPPSGFDEFSRLLVNSGPLSTTTTFTETTQTPDGPAVCSTTVYVGGHPPQDDSGLPIDIGSSR